MSVHLSNEVPLSDFIRLFCQRQFFCSQLSFGFWVYLPVIEQVQPAIVVSLGTRQLFSSEDRDVGWFATIRKQLDRTAGLVPYPNEAVGWVPWKPEFSS